MKKHRTRESRVGVNGDAVQIWQGSGWRVQITLTGEATMICLLGAQTEAIAQTREVCADLFGMSPDHGIILATRK